MKQRSLEPGEHAPYYSRYTDLVPETDILAVLQREGDATQKVLASIDESRASHRYAPGKWSILQIVGHIEDCERVFAYRALSIARGDSTPLPGFDQEVWMSSAPFDSSTLRKRAGSLALVRKSTIEMLRDLDDEAWERRGVASDAPVSVRALAVITAGHERHHMKILREKYL